MCGFGKYCKRQGIRICAEYFVKNPFMEYAVAAGVTIFFVFLYLLTRKKPRESAEEVCDEETFAKRAEEFASGLPAPQNGGKSISVKPFAKQIFKAMRVLDSEDSEKQFATFARTLKEKRKEIEEICAVDYAFSADLPSVGSVPRIYAVAKTVLSHSHYIFCADRCDTVFDAVNRRRTLTFAETDFARSAFYAVLTEKLGFLCADMCTLVKIRKHAKRIAAHPSLHKNSLLFKRLKNSAVFSRFCAAELYYETEKFDETFYGITDGLISCLNNVLDSFDNVRAFDFSSYYTPLEILSKFQVFVNADCECKRKFLDTVSKLSEKENLDETAYALRLAEYAERDRVPPTDTLRLSTYGKRAVIAVFREDMLLAARALTSETMMQMLFGASQKRKSIIKKTKIKNSFVPKIKQCAANFGISVNNDRLRINPRFPAEVVRAGVELSHKGVRHTVTIEAGEECLIVNGTVMKGVPEVRLGDEPLEIKVCVPFGDEHSGTV